MPETVRLSFTSGNNNPYTTDVGSPKQVVINLHQPEGVPDAQMTNIITAVGATVEPDPVPCLNDDDFNYRYLKFIRRGGGTTKIPVRTSNQVIAVATAVRAIFDGIGGAHTVVCIELVGEHFPNAIDSFQLRPAPVTFARIAPLNPPAGEGKSSIYWTGVMSTYQTDASDPAGAVVNAPMRILTNQVGNRATTFAEIDDCVDAPNVIEGVSCGTGNNRRTRRYKVDFGTIDGGGNEGTQSISVPVSSTDPADILDCGANLAQNQAVICMCYEGESYSKVIDLLP
ncbi:MAG: hypothetical protein AAGG51_23005 [Cyanobacteria bacterium P01_G01_bin.54]